MAQECARCGIRCTVATASGVVVDKQVKKSFCTQSRYGSHQWVEVSD